ncbi:MAG: leucine-rich repeat domain-containing protein, partial [Firmicutes bacterium]|nr:leucine-rich repeat domain-containing protein [Bacillota bacterium]
MKKKSFKNTRLLVLLSLPVLLLAAAFFAMANSSVTTQAQASSYTLQDSWVMDVLPNGNWVDSGGDWDSSWEFYNCYSFAIGKTDSYYNPGEHSVYVLGEYNDKFWKYMDDHTISQIAYLVKEDLDKLGGYGDVYVTTYDPDIIEPYQTKICVRKTTVNNEHREFHFMKYISDAWYHKPGGTAILKYKYHPEYKNWISERSYNNPNTLDPAYYGEHLTADRIYDSQIYYIVYGESPFTTTLSGGSITITGLKSAAVINGGVEIRPTMKISGTDYPVTAIGNGAFSSPKTATDLTGIIIPVDVTSIGASAFAGCTQLGVGWKPLVIPGTVTTIGLGAFAGCNNLT